MRVRVIKYEFLEVLLGRQFCFEGSMWDSLILIKEFKFLNIQIIES